MVVPNPPVNLEGHCSVIYNKTLYTYTPNGFVFIPLKYNGRWHELPMSDVPVSDAACVTAGIDGDETQQALYVVGGSSSEDNPPGLQRYSFKHEKWETIPLDVQDLSNRTSHSVVYLKSSATLLVYGGSREDTSEPSSSTFSLNARQQYHILSGSLKITSVAPSPSILTWSPKEAAMLEGQLNTSRVFLWNPNDEWHEASFNLTVPDGAKLALNDDRTLLHAFDMSASPVNVTSMVPPRGSQPPGKRQETNPPEYDDTFAPKTAPNDDSFAQGEDLVVISSGSGTDALSIFNQTSNGWVNATRLFYGDKSEQEILGTPTSSSGPAATETESTTSDQSSNGSGNDLGTIIGATLGSLIGAAAILLLILFLIKRKKDKMRKASGADRGRLSFQDQGVEPLARSAYPMAEGPAIRAASMDSLAMFSGKMGDEKGPIVAGTAPHQAPKTQPARPSPLNNIQSSRDSDRSSLDIEDKAIDAGNPYVQPGNRTTDEGWSKYFQNNAPTTLVGMQPQFNSVRDSSATLWPGAGGNSTHNALAPLNTNFLEQPKPLGKVNSGSPTTEPGRQILIPESQSARISSADSASIISDDDPDGQPEAREQSWLGRPPSSTYSRSMYNPQHTSSAAPSALDWRRHDSARTNTRGSSVLIPDGPVPNSNINKDMSWLNLNADR
ncbi:hypothetical protein BJX61DRAFT_94 [Aspergillus egyptiacus]|nr:hypothetical protein BJX61DRAFT_94 [Aspergillus egyptiacus]